MDKTIAKGSYQKKLAELQLRLRQIQQAYLATGDRGVVVFEGWDAGGKGGDDPPDERGHGPPRFQGLAHRRAA